ncbi:hypothetical protein [Ligilactobacillus murinus]|jgi:hypothetical protein|uniref:hypothetical protein n=1 Tax=Ligilactobacillus murinus TaxID=1622 RepID=UPI001094D020|nr:hypothetical protein [Ligilactobacillus murinus]TGY53025.1 hypothetical protein E5341_04015 [Ligilactobacillus murinus]
MNDKDFKEVLKNIFGLDAETLYTTLTEDEPTKDEKLEFTLEIADKTLKSGGFKRTLVVAEDGEGFGMSMPEHPIVAAHLIVAALERAPKGMLEHVLFHLNSKEMTSNAIR